MQPSIVSTDQGYLCSIPFRGEVDSYHVTGRDGLWYLNIRVDGRSFSVRLPCTEGGLTNVPPTLLVHTADQQSFKATIPPTWLQHFAGR